MAGPGSKNFGGKLWICRSPSASYASRAYRKLRFQVVSRLAAHRVDVVLNSGRLDYLSSLLRTNTPLVCRFDNPVSQSEIDWLLQRRRSSLQFVGISRNQIDGLSSTAYWNVVHNATDVDQLRMVPCRDKDQYLAFLGRLTYNKGVDTAIRVAQRTRMKLKIAGNLTSEPGAQQYFESEIKPHLGDRIEWVGPVNDIQKQELLGKARALLFPIRWKEPFGLVMIESLACGTPVIATRCASTPEVIEDGKTGFLCDDEDQLVEAVGKIDQIDRATCRSVAEERYSVRVSARQYLQVLEKAIQGCGKLESEELASSTVPVSHRVRRAMREGLR
jgi:glycosyltransferase involved in cell wall biosynthesis